LDGQDHDNEKNKHAEEDTMIIKSEKGVSAVEFALIAPLLFVLTFGIIEFSLLLFDKAVVTNASREGARAAIVYHEDEDGNYDAIPIEDIRDIVKEYALKYLIDLGTPGGKDLVDDDISVVYETGTPISGKNVTVTVTYPYNFLVFSNLIPLLSGGAFEGSIDLEGVTVMRME
jgi:Flp pilus assembly protein TadG